MGRNIRMLGRQLVGCVRLVSMLMLEIGTSGIPAVSLHLMTLPTYMPVRMHPRDPRRQQGDADEERDERACLAELIQHLRQ